MNLKQIHCKYSTNFVPFFVQSIVFRTILLLTASKRRSLLFFVLNSQMICSLKFCPQNQKVDANKKQNFSRFNIVSQASQFQFHI